MHRAWLLLSRFSHIGVDYGFESRTKSCQSRLRKAMDDEVLQHIPCVLTDLWSGLKDHLGRRKEGSRRTICGESTDARDLEDTPGPGCDEGKGPVPRQYLGRSEIGVVLVSSLRPTAPADDRKTVREALTYALELGHNRRKWTDHTGGLKGYDTWIRAMETGIAGRFGLGYNAAVWAESRRFAVQFLKEAQERLDNVLTPLFTAALGHYETVAQNLKAVSDKYPFKECEDERTPVDEYSREAVEALKRARDAEVAGLNVLAELINRLT